MSAALPTKPTYADVANTTGRGTSVSAPRMSRSVMPYEATSELSLAGKPLIASLFCASARVVRKVDVWARQPQHKTASSAGGGGGGGGDNSKRTAVREPCQDSVHMHITSKAVRLGPGTSAVGRELYKLA